VESSKRTLQAAWERAADGSDPSQHQQLSAIFAYRRH
jgi:hypothetical protein